MSKRAERECNELAAHLLAAARRFPSRIAFKSADTALSYAELFDRSEQLAEELFAHGLTLGSTLTTVLPGGSDFITVLLAAIHRGLIFAPLAPELGQNDLHSALEAIAPHFVLAPQTFFQRSGLKSAQSAEIFGSLSSPLTLMRPAANKTRPDLRTLCPEGGFIRFSSGTSGRSKGVVISSSSALARIHAGQGGLQIRESDRVLFLMSLPYHFITALLLFLSRGAAVLLPGGTSPRAALRLLQYHPTVIYGAPFHYESLIQSAAEDQLPQLRLAISTSTRLHPDTARNFREKFDRNLFQSYGVIEVGLPLGNMSQEETDARSVGRAFPDYEIGFFDEHGKFDPSAASGILAIRGPGMFDGYLRPFSRREEILPGGWFLTGDIAEQDASGNIYIHGRATSVMHIAGHKIFPEEVEDVLCAHPEIREAHVFARPHEIFGSVMTARIVRQPGSGLSDSEVIAYGKIKLGRIKTPQAVEFVDALPKTKTEKLLR
jgi:acyl-coenzyme A synthetase/AMP-(fatty) acid ligase